MMSNEHNYDEKKVFTSEIIAEKQIINLFQFNTSQ